MSKDFIDWLTQLQHLAAKENIRIEAQYIEALDFFYKSQYSIETALKNYKNTVTRLYSIDAGKEVNPFKLNDFKVMDIMASRDFGGKKMEDCKIVLFP